MTNLQYITKKLSDNGIANTHKEMITLLTSCIENYDEIEWWVENYVWLFNEVPKTVLKYLEKGEKNVQFSENTDIDLGRHDVIMPES